MPYVFDAYGTLFDFNAAIARHRAAAGPDADRFSEVWRHKQIEYTWTHTLAGRYVEFWTLTQRALDYCFERFPSVDRTLRDDLLDAYLKLDAFPDARQVLRELKARGERTAILSNGSPAMLGVGGRGGRAQGRARRGAFGRHRQDVQAAARGLCAGHRRNSRVKPAEVMFVSSNRWDAMGATAFGFRTVWVNRGKAPDEYPDFPPVAVVTDLTGLLSVKV